jgi:hypothetical protein
MAGLSFEKYPSHYLAANHDVDQPLQHLHWIARSDNFKVPDFPCHPEKASADLLHRLQTLRPVIFLTRKSTVKIGPAKRMNSIPETTSHTDKNSFMSWQRVVQNPMTFPASPMQVARYKKVGFATIPLQEEKR